MKPTMYVFGAVLLFAAVPAGRAALCKKCRAMMFIMSVGKCEECGGRTTSGGHRLCPKCSARLGECEHCRAKLGGGARKADEDTEAPTRTVDEKANGKTVALAVGDTVAVTLKGTPTTGYNWQLGGIEGDAVRLQGNIAFRTGTPPGRQGAVVGAGGTFRTLLAAVKPGRSKVTLEYRRPREKEKGPEKTFTLTVVVKAPDKKTDP